MRVSFDGATAQHVPLVGLDLQPGDNEVTEEQGEALIKAGIARAARRTAPAKASPAPDGSQG